MVNRVQFLFFLWITLIQIVTSSKIGSLISSYVGPIPPQPSQYTTSMQFNGQATTYYADTTIDRDRLDIADRKQISIIDFKNYRLYVLLEKTCSWSQIPGKIEPLLAFSTYEFLGNLTHNKTICNEWRGCHNYEIPPAPFYYYATVQGNIPVDLNLPTIDVSIHFSNFTFGPPPPSTFDIPKNCTEIQFKQIFHPILSRFIIKKSPIGIFC